jgi:DNA-binding IclR family transcriptional regulator
MKITVTQMQIMSILEHQDCTLHQLVTKMRKHHKTVRRAVASLVRSRLVKFDRVNYSLNNDISDFISI